MCYEMKCDSYVYTAPFKIVLLSLPLACESVLLCIIMKTCGEILTRESM